MPSEALTKETEAGLGLDYAGGRGKLAGLQWGDEGKAKILDALAEQNDIVVRFQGGANAGHTVVVKKERFAFHLVPSGILRENKVCVIAGGCVVDAGELLREVEELKARGVRIDGANLRLSDRAHLVMPYHKLLDQLSETRKEQAGREKLGTTGRGIGPAYVDKAARSGLRVGDLRRPRYFAERVAARLEELNPLLQHLYGREPLDPPAVSAEVLRHAEALGPFIADTAEFINAALDRKQRLLFEGAQGTLLDLDHGSYPFVTSSSASAGGAATGSGISPRRINTVLGVLKAYCTRVGSGPFPSELTDAMGETLREHGGEYGTTTGRPRRCGWFDAVGARYAAQVSGAEALALTKLDVLSEAPEVRICTAYQVQGRMVHRFPADCQDLAEAVPVYETYSGWREPLEGLRKYEKLPRAARFFVERLEELLKLPIRFIGVGRSREALIHRPG
jgi:adenylosuccinate synthase